MLTGVFKWIEEPLETPKLRQGWTLIPRECVMRLHQTYLDSPGDSSLMNGLHIELPELRTKIPNFGFKPEA